MSEAPLTRLTADKTDVRATLLIPEVKWRHYSGKVKCYWTSGRPSELEERGDKGQRVKQTRMR